MKKLPKFFFPDYQNWHNASVRTSYMSEQKLTHPPEVETCKVRRGKWKEECTCPRNALCQFKILGIHSPEQFGTFHSSNCTQKISPKQESQDFQNPNGSTSHGLSLLDSLYFYLLRHSFFLNASASHVDPLWTTRPNSVNSWPRWGEEEARKQMKKLERVVFCLWIIQLVLKDNQRVTRIRGSGGWSPGTPSDEQHLWMSHSSEAWSYWLPLWSAFRRIEKQFGIIMAQIQMYQGTLNEDWG